MRYLFDRHACRDSRKCCLYDGRTVRKIMIKFKVGDLVKVNSNMQPDFLTTFPEELRDKSMRVSKITKDEVYTEYEGDTYGFSPSELELTSKLHEVLE